jgi:hypothetical protein
MSAGRPFTISEAKRAAESGALDPYGAALVLFLVGEVERKQAEYDEHHVLCNHAFAVLQATIDDLRRVTITSTTAPIVTSIDDREPM